MSQQPGSESPPADLWSAVTCLNIRDCLRGKERNVSRQIQELRLITRRRLSAYP